MNNLQIMKINLQSRTAECESMFSELTDAKMQLDSLNLKYEEIDSEFQNVKDQLITELQKVNFEEKIILIFVGF